MLHSFSRTELLIGTEGLDILRASKVGVFGIGGVGSYVAEALARAGIGNLTLVDYDVICLTNINRQLHALHSTVGQPKVDVMKARIKQINPRAEVEAVRQFYLPENGEALFKNEFDYVVDAIDTVTSKVDLVVRAKSMGIPIISAMGAGNRLDATGFIVADISETKVCPLAKVMRKELRKRGIQRGVKVVYSSHRTLRPKASVTNCRSNCICPGEKGNCTKRRSIPGSISFVPAVVGLLIAGEVVNDLLARAGIVPGSDSY